MPPSPRPFLTAPPPTPFVPGQLPLLLIRPTASSFLVPGLPRSRLPSFVFLTTPPSFLVPSSTVTGRVRPASRSQRWNRFLISPTLSRSWSCGRADLHYPPMCRSFLFSHTSSRLPLHVAFHIGGPRFLAGSPWYRYLPCTLRSRYRLPPPPHSSKFCALVLRVARGEVPAPERRVHRASGSHHHQPATRRQGTRRVHVRQGVLRLSACQWPQRCQLIRIFAIFCGFAKL